MPKVSVIIPVYGVEKYIERCARSLFSQTLDDIEFIFIDDCSPDSSIEILRRIIEEYRLRIAEKGWKVRTERMLANSGQAAVRKHGIQLAIGEYIAHCDSDDWVDADMYRAMYEKGKVEDADVVVCDYAVADENIVKEVIKGCHSADIKQFTENLLFQKDPWALWNKLFKRTTYSIDLIFPKGNMGEDMVLVLQLIRNCKTIGYVPHAFYYYQFNEQSITKSVMESKVYSNFLQAIDNVAIVDEVYSGGNDERKIKSAIKSIKWGQKAVLYPLITLPKYYKIWRNVYPNLEMSILLDSNCNYRLRIKCLLTLLRIYPWRDYSKR